MNVGPTYTEDGFTISNLSNTTSSTALLSPRSGNTTYYAGSAALFNNSGNGTTELVKDSGGTFDLFSIDLTEVDINRLGPTSVDFTGHLFGGGTITQSIGLDGVFGFETLFFSGFENLTSVTWVQSPQFHQFDNIRIDVAAVSEPSVLALLGLGLVGVGFSRKKKTT